MSLWYDVWMPSRSPEESIAASELVIDKKLRTMLGWVKAFVEPPWKGTPTQCRGCGRDPMKTDAETPGFRFVMAALTMPDEKKKVLYYSFALVDEACAKNEKMMAEITDQAFTALRMQNTNGAG